MVKSSPTRAQPQRSVAEVVEQLRASGNPANLPGMARYGMPVEHRLGVSVPVLRKMAKQIGKNHALALQLWRTGIDDARILASMVDDPARVTERQMEQWVRAFNGWDVCDQVCMNLFDKTPYAWSKPGEWAARDEEFVKRAAYALIAVLAWHDQTAPNDRFIEFLPLIRQGAGDDRNYVKKAVNWALRGIGKRNFKLNRAAIAFARELRQTDSRAAKWIAKDALRELESEDTRQILARNKNRAR